MNAYAIPGLTKKTPEDIIFESVCKNFGKDPKEVRLIKTRQRPYVTIRQVSMTLMRVKLPYASWQKIADYFFKNHATVIASYRTVKNLYETDRYFREQISPLLDGYKL